MLTMCIVLIHEHPGRPRSRLGFVLMSLTIVEVPHPYISTFRWIRTQNQKRIDDSGLSCDTVTSRRTLTTYEVDSGALVYNPVK